MQVGQDLELLIAISGNPNPRHCLYGQRLAAGLGKRLALLGHFCAFYISTRPLQLLVFIRPLANAIDTQSIRITLFYRFTLIDVFESL